MNELGRIALLRSIYGGGDAPAHEVVLGIGDDAAVLAAPAPGERLVWTVDEQVEGTHFRREWLSLGDVGWRAVMAAASDVAAMGARPIALLSSLVLPAAIDDVELEALARGTKAASDALGIAVAGGNLARGATLVVSTTVLGASRAPIPRSRAAPGDALWLAGPVGLAAVGMRLLAGEGARAGASLVAAGDAKDASRVRAIAAWRRPVARIPEGLAMASLARAAIDVSDGLARDAAHLADASGVAIVLDAAAIVSPDLAALATGEDDALALALAGGEDYALLAAAPGPLPGFTRVGHARAGTGVHLARGGRESVVEVDGFDHFR